MFCHITYKKLDDLSFLDRQAIIKCQPSRRDTGNHRPKRHVNMVYMGNMLIESFSVFTNPIGERIIIKRIIRLTFFA